MNKKYTINEVAKIFNITTNKIRYYEEKQLLEPLRDSNNEYRIFDEKDIFKLQAILLYRSIGLPIKEIQDILKNNTNANYLNHFNKQWKIVNSQIHRLTTIRESLENIIDNIYENDSCKIDDNILGIIEKTYELNKIKENWKDRWNFDSWARNYDKDVREDKGDLKIYANYDSILDKVYNLAVDSNINKPCILEIGVETGNLSGKFLDKGYNIIAIDQSIEMLNVAKEKYPKLKVRLGDFLKIPYSNKTFDIIVSTYAFHHLNNNEKSIAIKEMARVLKDNGKIVIGDLMFKSNKDKENIFQKLTSEQIEEINDEYYSYIDFLKGEFKEINKELKYTRIDNLIYVVEIQ